VVKDDRRQTRAASLNCRKLEMDRPAPEKLSPNPKSHSLRFCPQGATLAFGLKNHPTPWSIPFARVASRESRSLRIPTIEYILSTWSAPCSILHRCKPVTNPCSSWTNLWAWRCSQPQPQSSYTTHYGRFSWYDLLEASKKAIYSSRYSLSWMTIIRCKPFSLREFGPFAFQSSSLSSPRPLLELSWPWS
jgi:hypothetical protein